MAAGASRAACWLHDAEGRRRAASRRRAAMPDACRLVRIDGAEALLRRLAAVAEPRARAQAAPDRCRRSTASSFTIAKRRDASRWWANRAAASRRWRAWSSGCTRRPRGTIAFDGIDMAQPQRSRADMPALRRRMQMIFQDPYASLNPRWRVRDIVAEPIRALRPAPRTSARSRKRVGELLRQVGLTPADGEKYPARVLRRPAPAHLDRARAGEQPEFLVCDEPTSALDVSVQAQILNLMRTCSAARAHLSLHLATTSRSSRTSPTASA